MGEQLFSAAEICRRAGIHRSTFYRWVQLGLVPRAAHKQVGRRGRPRVLFTNEALEIAKRLKAGEIIPLEP